MRIGIIEAGGTKFVCGIGNEKGEIEDRVRIPTEQPQITMDRVIRYFRGKEVDAIGVGTFGPIELDVSSSRYGCLTTTPKPGWAGFPFLPTLQEALDVPYGWDTDVNAAAIGEATWGAARGLDNCVYFTIGTGIGMGVYLEGKPLHGLVHPEGGHVMVRRHPRDEFEGICPYHQDCLAGMASGPAIEKRWGIKGSELPEDHPAWALEAYYIGQAAATAILMLSPKKVILGGGVMQQKRLFPRIHDEVLKTLKGFVDSELLISQIDSYIVPPGLGEYSGLYGALALGLRSIENR